MHRLFTGVGSHARHLLGEAVLEVVRQRVVVVVERSKLRGAMVGQALLPGVGHALSTHQYLARFAVSMAHRLPVLIGDCCFAAAASRLRQVHVVLLGTQQRRLGGRHATLLH